MYPFFLETERLTRKKKGENAGYKEKSSKLTRIY